MARSSIFRLGLILNPFAGVGGPAAHKGSDATAIQAAATQGQLALTAPARARTFLQALQGISAQFELLTIPGAMGEAICRELGYSCTLIDYVPASPSSGLDTERAAAILAATGVDLLVIIGGDGTARDVCRVLGESQLVLGVPAGVKMHSGVYAVNPQSAAEVVRQLVAGELVSVNEAEVRDIDEDAFRRGQVKSRYFGSMQVPDEVRFVQQVKQGGQEVESLVLADMAAHIEESFDDNTLYIFGPGSTTHQILQNLKWPSTLLGFDLFKGGQQLVDDASAADLIRCVRGHSGPVALYITAIGGQGHILGRGNQQLTPELLRQIGRENLQVVATKTKLKNLQGRPLLMDSGDPQLDTDWSGYIRVLTGYHDAVLYPLGHYSDSGELPGVE
jgi:predicted polyphosphate/ATP-dependent NAD kinase